MVEISVMPDLVMCVTSFFIVRSLSDSSQHRAVQLNPAWPNGTHSIIYMLLLFMWLWCFSRSGSPPTARDFVCELSVGLLQKRNVRRVPCVYLLPPSSSSSSSSHPPTHPPAASRQGWCSYALLSLHLDADSAQSCWDDLTLLCARAMALEGPQRIIL